MPTQLVNLPEQINGFAPAYVDGLDIRYNASGSVSVQPGTAFVPSLGRFLTVTGAIVQNIPIVSTNTSGSWQHVYAGENNGVPYIQVTGTAPSTPYSGVARTKTGDASLRYLGSVYCDTGGYLYRWNSDVFGNVWKINWLEANSVFPFQFANVSGTVSTPTTIPVPWLVPSTFGLVIEMMIQAVHSLTAAGANVISISDVTSIAEPNPAAVNNEVVSLQTNGTAATNNIQLSAVPVKISTNLLKYTHVNIAGTNGAIFRIRGVSVQR